MSLGLTIAALRSQSHFPHSRKSHTLPARTRPASVNRSLLEGLETRLLFATFTVTTNSDVPIIMGTTLRQAITEANLSPGPNTIKFNLPVGETTIQPILPLPAVTTPTVIDGTSQPGYSGKPIVWIEATGMSSGNDGLTLNGNNSGVKGLAVTGFFGGDGVALEGSSDYISGDYLGIDPSGGTASGTITAEANGSGASADGTNASVTGNVLSNNEYGLQINGSGAIVTGNDIGTDPTGTQSRGNNLAGINLTNAGGVTIGGTTAAARNIVSGNFTDGIDLTDSGPGDVILGNYIGLDATGAAAIPFVGGPGNGGDGITISASTDGATTAVTVGGTVAGAANVISSEQADGILIEGGSGNIIEGNLLGTDASGTNGITTEGNDIDLEGASSNNTIGGSGSAGNVISDSQGNGINFGTDSTTTGNVVAGNKIGTDITGTAAIPNAGNGIEASYNVVIGTSGAGNIISGNTGNGVQLDGSGNVLSFNAIGAEANTYNAAALGNSLNGVLVLGNNNTIGSPTTGNSIAYNGGTGVTVGSSPASVNAIDNAIRGNNIYLNGGLGIDLGNDGVTMNDPGDADVGPNNFQNFPVLTAVTLSGDVATITGTLNSTPLSTFSIDFFTSQIWDTTHYGEGQKYLGSISVTTDASGNASFTATLSGVPSGFDYFASTATDVNGNTSEFDYDPEGSAPAAASLADIKRLSKRPSPQQILHLIEAIDGGFTIRK
jgi:hypothetical protein